MQTGDLNFGRWGGRRVEVWSSNWSGERADSSLLAQVNWLMVSVLPCYAATESLYSTCREHDQEKFQLGDGNTLYFN